VWRCDAKRSDQLVTVLGQCLTDLTQCMNVRCCFLVQRATRLAESHAMGGSVKQLGVDLLLEPHDCSADRPFGELQLLRGLGEAQLLGDRDEDQIEVELGRCCAHATPSW